MANQEARGTQNTGPASSFLLQIAFVVPSFVWVFNTIISLLGYKKEIDKDALSWGAAKFDALEQWQQNVILVVVVLLLLYCMYCCIRWTYAKIHNQYMTEEAKAEQDYENFLEEQGYDNKRYGYVAIGIGDQEFVDSLNTLQFKGKPIQLGKRAGPFSFTAVRNKQKNEMLQNPMSVFEWKLKTLFSASKLKDAGFNLAQLKEGEFTASELKAVNFTLAELKAGNFTASELKAANFTLAELKAGGYSQQELADLGCFVFSSNFDTNGVLHHIGTKGGTQEYANPHTSGEVVAKWSSVGNGSIENFVQHQHSGSVYSYTNNKENSWMQVDLGASRSLRPTHYCLRNDGVYACALRSWTLQGSNDESSWVALRDHKNDTSLPHKSKTAAANWSIDDCAESYRWFRVQMRGKNSNGGHHLCCAGIELYGDLDNPVI